MCELWTVVTALSWNYLLTSILLQVFLRRDYLKQKSWRVRIKRVWRDLSIFICDDVSCCSEKLSREAEAYPNFYLWPMGASSMPFVCSLLEIHNNNNNNNIQLQQGWRRSLTMLVLKMPPPLLDCLCDSIRGTHWG